MYNDSLSPIRIFIAYSKDDKSFLDDLLKHFYPAIRNKSIEVFHDGIIEAGDEWDKTIKYNLHNSDIILLLVSANFIATDYCYNEEMTDAIALHEQNKAQVIPIMVRHFAFKNTPFAKLNFLPEKAKPISSYADPHEAYTHIVEHLEEHNYPIAVQRRKAQAAAEQAKKEQAKKEKEAKEAAQKQEHAFLELCQQGDEFFGQKKWKEAQMQYTQALPLHQNGHAPTRETIKEKINDCADKISVADHLSLADKCEQERNYTEAIAQLQAAISSRIQELQNKAEAKAKQEAEERAKHEAEEKTKLKSYTETAFGLKLEMKYVEGGTFNMGSNDYDNEMPIHSVSIPSFCIGVYAVTQAQWLAVMGNNPSDFKGNNLPVENVSWDDVQAFIKKLNEKKTGRQYRLPTEAEWEYAARGGVHSKWCEYAGSNNVAEVAWYDENSNATPHAVGQKQPNELGLYDMSGNVWEWCQDQWHDDYQDAPTDGTAWEAGTSSQHVIRGGSWFNSPQFCRVAFRFNSTPNDLGNDLGFRLVVSL